MRSQHVESGPIEARGKSASSAPKRVLVLGGHGFIGRYTVESLKRRSATVIVGTRGCHRKAAKMCEKELRVRLHESVTQDGWIEVLQGVDVVINTVGILRERSGESFESVHHLAVSALSRACQKCDIPLVHMSALGIDGQLSTRFTQSKLRGEQALFSSQCAGAVVRASVVDAPDGYGSGWLHRVAKWPVWLMPAGAVHLLSPIHASDLGEALAELSLTTAVKPAKLVELGCGENFTLADYLQRLRNNCDGVRSYPWVMLRVPRIVSRFFAHVFDIFHITPYSIGHHELLERDNIPQRNELPRLLGRVPTQIGKIDKTAVETSKSNASNINSSEPVGGAR